MNWEKYIYPPNVVNAQFVAATMRYIFPLQRLAQLFEQPEKGLRIVFTSPGEPNKPNQLFLTADPTRADTAICFIQQGSTSQIGGVRLCKKELLE